MNKDELQNTLLKIGHLVFDTVLEKLMFCDSFGKYFPMDNVFWLGNEHNNENGTKNLPKAFVVTNNKIIEDGELLVYTYINGAKQNILVLGTFINRNLGGYSSFLDVDVKNKENLRKKYSSRSNKKRFFSVYDDAAGNVTIILKGKEDADTPGTGDLAIKVTGTDGHGNLNLSLNGKFVINQTQIEGETETVIAQILMDSTKNAERIKVIDKYKNRFEFTKDGIVVKDKSANLLEMNATGVILETATIRVGKTETVKKILDDLIAAILKLTQNTPAGPTISPPINKAEFDAIKNRLTQFMDTQ